VGYIAHDAVIVTTEDFRPGGLPDMEEFRASMPEHFRHLVIGPVETAVNGTKAYVFLPVGSKEGWADSALGDEWREKFKALFRLAHDNVSTPDDVVSIRFGGDFGSEVGATLTVDWPRSE
jgi:hypothetical protein